MQGITREKIVRYLADLVVGHDHDAVNSKGINTPALFAYLAGSYEHGSTGSFEEVPIDTELWSLPTGLLFSGGSRLVIPAGTGGLWVVGAQVSFEANTTGYYEIRLRRWRDAASTVIVTKHYPTPANTISGPSCITLEDLEFEDEIEVQAYQSSGGDLAYESDRSRTFLYGFLVGRVPPEGTPGGAPPTAVPPGGGIIGNP